MRLWLLERIGETDWDEAAGFVVRAESESAARTVVADPGGGREFGDEGAETWRDASKSTCRELVADGEPGVILRDFNAA